MITMVRAFTEQHLLQDQNIYLHIKALSPDNYGWRSSSTVAFKTLTQTHDHFGICLHWPRLEIPNVLQSSLYSLLEWYF